MPTGRVPALPRTRPQPSPALRWLRLGSLPAHRGTGRSRQALGHFRRPSAISAVPRPSLSILGPPAQHRPLPPILGPIVDTRPFPPPLGSLRHQSRPFSDPRSFPSPLGPFPRQSELLAAPRPCASALSASDTGCATLESPRHLGSGPGPGVPRAPRLLCSPPPPALREAARSPGCPALSLAGVGGTGPPRGPTGHSARAPRRSWIDAPVFSVRLLNVRCAWKSFPYADNTTLHFLLLDSYFCFRFPVGAAGTGACARV